MKSFSRRFTVLLALLLLAAARVDASIVSLEFAPSTQTINLGAQATVDINVTGLSGELVGAFDFDVLWDPGLLSLASANFGASLGGPLVSFQSDPLSDIFNPTSGLTGVANMSELSLLSDLGAVQNGTDPFTLFSLTFDTLATGTSSLSFGPGLFGDFLVDESGFFSLPTDASDTGSITIERSSAIAEPGVLALMALGLLLPGFMRGRLKRANV